jgi:signal-transduction protein with cAMP-binding, CBS, and nucleotidyltransferase domain
MRIDEIPEYKDKEHILTMDRDAGLVDAVQRMSDMNYGSVVVTENGKLAGIVTERDLMRRIVAEDKNPHDFVLGDVMTTNVKTARESDEVTDSLRRMSQGKFRHLPIVDDDNTVVGLVSQGDFVAFTWPQIIHRLAENTRASLATGYQPVLLVIAVMIYSLFLVSAF